MGLASAQLQAQQGQQIANAFRQFGSVFGQIGTAVDNYQGAKAVYDQLKDKIPGIQEPRVGTTAKEYIAEIVEPYKELADEETRAQLAAARQARQTTAGLAVGALQQEHPEMPREEAFGKLSRTPGLEGLTADEAKTAGLEYAFQPGEQQKPMTEYQQRGLGLREQQLEQRKKEHEFKVEQARTKAKKAMEEKFDDMQLTVKDATDDYRLLLGKSHEVKSRIAALKAQMSQSGVTEAGKFVFEKQIDDMEMTQKQLDREAKAMKKYRDWKMANPRGTRTLKEAESEVVREEMGEMLGSAARRERGTRRQLEGAPEALKQEFPSAFEPVGEVPIPRSEQGREYGQTLAAKQGMGVGDPARQEAIRRLRGGLVPGFPPTQNPTPAQIDYIAGLLRSASGI